MKLLAHLPSQSLALVALLSLPASAGAAVPSGPALGGQADTTRYVVAPDGNEARYRVREQLVGVSFPNDAVGVTKAITGMITVDPAGRVVPGGSVITVDLVSMASDRDMRDGYVRRNTLVTETYPSVVLRPTELRGLPWPLPAAGSVTFQLVGNLTVKDVTRSTTWDVTLTVAGNTLSGSASTSFTFEEFGLTKPRVARVMSVEDTIKLEYDLKLVRQ
ncbi:MAG: YceI family protein [Gemmatimonadales bacterium]|nr:YceI family protein [Gemmatimonadales bacterium]